MSSFCPTCHAVTKDDTSKISPSAKVPGTPMAGILPDPQQGAGVIAFLSTLKE